VKFSAVIAGTPSHESLSWRIYLFGRFSTAMEKSFCKLCNICQHDILSCVQLNLLLPNSLSFLSMRIYFLMVFHTSFRSSISSFTSHFSCVISIDISSYLILHLYLFSFFCSLQFENNAFQQTLKPPNIF
jgi:hypothetical protein